MTPVIERHLDPERMRSIARHRNYDQVSFDEYVRIVSEGLEEEETIEYEEEDYVANVLDYADAHMKIFSGARDAGFSEIWSRELAVQTMAEDRNTVSYAYEASKEANKNQALADLKLYCKINDKDEHFEKHFIHLLEVDIPNPDPSVVVQADKYSKFYKEQTGKGKSSEFASRYADLKAYGQYTEFYCNVEAAEYDKAIQKTQSKDFAHAFSMKIADYIGDRFSNYEVALKDVLVQQERKRLEEKFSHLK